MVVYSVSSTTRSYIWFFAAENNTIDRYPEVSLLDWFATEVSLPKYILEVSLFDGFAL